MKEEEIEKIMNRYWDKEFLETINKHSFKICEHDLIKTIKMALSDALETKSPSGQD